MKLLYKVKGINGKGFMYVPVKVKEGSLNESGDFGRKDCIIIPVGGRGELRVNYHNLVINK